jgi:hypothetical protein
MIFSLSHDVTKGRADEVYALMPGMPLAVVGVLRPGEVPAGVTEL